MVEYRYELKFLTNSQEEGADTLLANLSSWGFRKAFARRAINNFYFDSHGFSALSDGLSGAAPRSKLRLRWYGLEDNILNPQLELKSKNAEVITKEVIQFKGSLDLWNCSRSFVLRQLKTNFGPKGLLWLGDHDQITLFNRYVRDYFESPEGLRLTIDRQLKAYDLFGGPLVKARRAIEQKELVVIELKGPIEKINHLQEVASRWPIRRQPFSKYVQSFLRTAWY